MSRGKILVKNIFVSVLAFIFTILIPIGVKAAEQSVEFNAKRYDKNSGTEFSVGTYLKSDVALSTYTIVIEYDKSRLKLVSGGDSVDAANGIVTCTGSGSYLQNIKLWLNFEATSGGEAYITVVSAEAVGSDGTEYVISNLTTVPVYLKGDDVSEQNLLELGTADDAATDSVEAENVDGNGEDDMSEAGSDEDGASVDTTDGSSGDSGIEDDGDNMPEESINLKAIIYWVAVAAIIIILVTIILVSTFGGKKSDKNKTSEYYEEDEEQELIFEGEEENQDDSETIDEEPEESEEYDGWVEEPEAEEEPEVEEEPEAEEEPDIKKEVKVKAEVDSETVFAAENVTVRCKVRSKDGSKADYDVINVLDNISVNINRGELVEITGTSNRELEAFIYLLAGKCKIRSGNITKAPQRCRIVTAKSCFAPNLTVRANIYRSGALMGHPKTVLDRCFNRIVKFAGAESVLEKPAGSISGTTIHKLEIALALLDDRAEILILGNVLEKCDDNFVRKCNVILDKMIAKNMTVLLFGIIPEEISANCSRTIRIINGHIVER